MTIDESESTAAYQAIVGNLLALRDEARNGNDGEVKAINCILATAMSLQLVDRFSRIPVPGTRKSSEPVPTGITGRVSKQPPSSLTDTPWRVPPLAGLVPN